MPIASWKMSLQRHGMTIPPNGCGIPARFYPDLQISVNESWNEIINLVTIHMIFHGKKIFPFNKPQRSISSIGFCFTIQWENIIQKKKKYRWFRLEHLPAPIPTALKLVALYHTQWQPLSLPVASESNLLTILSVHSNVWHVCHASATNRLFSFLVDCRTFESTFAMTKIVKITRCLLTVNILLLAAASMYQFNT